MKRIRKTFSIRFIVNGVLFIRRFTIITITITCVIIFAFLKPIKNSIFFVTIIRIFACHFFFWTYGVNTIIISYASIFIITNFNFTVFLIFNNLHRIMNIHVTIDFLQFNNLFVSLQSELQNEHLDKYKYQKKERKLFLILTLSTIEESSSLDSPRIVESDNTDDIS